MDDYRSELLRALPWVDAPLVGRCLDAVVSFPDLGLRPPCFGDGELPIPLPFFPLFERQTETQFGVWIADPRSLGGAILVHYFDGQHASYLGRSGCHLALDLLEASRSLDHDEEPSRPLAEHLFPAAPARKMQALVERVRDGDFDPCSPLELELSTWPIISDHLSTDDEIDPRGGEAEGYGDCAWLAELAWRPTRDGRVQPPRPVNRFHAALQSGDVRAAWGALGSSGWSGDEVRAAWATLAPLVDPTLKRLVDAKLSDEDGFPAHEGY